MNNGPMPMDPLHVTHVPVQVKCCNNPTRYEPILIIRQEGNSKLMFICTLSTPL